MTQPLKAILLDIEGTTSSIEFVYNVMFPFAKNHVAAFLNQHWQRSDVQEAVQFVANDAGKSDATSWLGEQPEQERPSFVCSHLLQLMESDSKATD